ncbi:hypothetical protein [Methylopila sp. M107]|uniref:hypothetical protein n=1 Tax=Methylopila sp. M107 TaxID=1101190 RepID=UPI00037E6EBC|nr:hypothetical protein [Methylopila sp. M107]
MELVLVSCLIGAPADCREERLLVSASAIAPMACLSGAPAAIAEWAEEHADRAVARWRCESADRRARR